MAPPPGELAGPQGPPEGASPSDADGDSAYWK